jgi:hypothetical protein
MTPPNCLYCFKYSTRALCTKEDTLEAEQNNGLRFNSVFTGTAIKPLVASSGLSIQYAIMMGLVHDAGNHKGEKRYCPPNCYGGTNDQARRVAACIEKKCRKSIYQLMVITIWFKVLMSF